MRIRKRFPTSSIPLADPQLSRSPMVQLQVQPHGNLHFQRRNIDSQPSDPPNHPSDQTKMITDEKARWVSHSKMKHKDLEGQDLKEDTWVKDDDKNNDDIIRKECTLNEEIDITLLLSSSSSSDDQDRGRWYHEGDKVVPLKKRKGSFERNTKVVKWKSKTNKKCLQKNDEDEVKEKNVVQNIDNGGNSMKKKMKRGNVIMEGSRCSRVNGRGWRCCQQTLVGYSLCEHHLGKGRLRSISSTVVQKREIIDINSTSTPQDYDEAQVLLSLGEYQEKKSVLMEDYEDGDDDNDYAKPIKKKKKKLGNVKARSMSSLLGQMDNAVVVASSSSRPKNQ